MEKIIAVGQRTSIPQRTITDEMLDQRDEWRASLGLTTQDDRSLVSGQPAKILRAYIRAPDRDSPSIKVEVTDTEVLVTGIRRGPAGVDIIDEASEPMGTIDFNAFHEFRVVRQGSPLLPKPSPEEVEAPLDAAGAEEEDKQS